MDIREMLKEKRAEAQLTQEQLAEKIYVSKKTISNWETGKTTPDIDSLILLANLFDFSLDNLLLKGSDLVENIKKQEAAKIARRYWGISWIINLLLFLVFMTQKFFGELSFEAYLLVASTFLLNSITLTYFAKELAQTHENKSPIRVLFEQNKLFLVFILISVVLMVVLMFL